MTTEGHGPEALPPGASYRARRFAFRLLNPIEKFLHIEASSGILLLVTAVVALVWANSPWASTYEHLLHTPISLGFGEHDNVCAEGAGPDHCYVSGFAAGGVWAGDVDGDGLTDLLMGAEYGARTKAKRTSIPRVAPTCSWDRSAEPSQPRTPTSVLRTRTTERWVSHSTSSAT